MLLEWWPSTMEKIDLSKYEENVLSRSIEISKNKYDELIQVTIIYRNPNSERWKRKFVWKSFYFQSILKPKIMFVLCFIKIKCLRICQALNNFFKLYLMHKYWKFAPILSCTLWSIFTDAIPAWRYKLEFLLSIFYRIYV